MVEVTDQPARNFTISAGRTLNWRRAFFWRMTWRLGPLSNPNGVFTGGFDSPLSCRPLFRVVPVNRFILHFYWDFLLFFLRGSSVLGFRVFLYLSGGWERAAATGEVTLWH